MARGDHIYVVRKAGYSHHGIDYGDGTVIHFSGEPGAAKRDACITRASLDDFLKGGRLKVREYGLRDDPDTTIARAESELGSTNYHLISNNCEHFATWCCTGKKASAQVRGATSLTTHGVVTGTSAAATVPLVATAGAVAGVSGPGIMTGLASAGGLIGGGAAAGPTAIALIPTAASLGIVTRTLRDDETLTDGERASRRAGRTAAKVAAPTSLVAGGVTLWAAGTTGVSAVGISTGLATVGGVVGGGMMAGTVILASAPAVVVAGAGAGVYFAARFLLGRRRSKQCEVDGPNDV